MKNALHYREDSDKTQKSIYNVLSINEMITIRGGGKVGGGGSDDDGGFTP